MKYRLFVFDLDGTVLGKDYRIAAPVLTSVERLRARGAHVAIATGRMLASARPFAEALGVVTPLVTYNGAWIRCTRTETDLLHQALAPDDALEVLEAIASLGLHANVYHDDQLLFRELTPEAKNYLAHTNVDGHLRADWSCFASGGPTKILAIGDKERMPAAEAALRERFGGRVATSRSLPIFIDITHPKVNKAVAIARLADTLGIARQEVVAVGDGFNDAEMLDWAGLGVAMGNAPAALRDQADRVTLSVDEHGVAALVDDLILEGVA